MDAKKSRTADERRFTQMEGRLPGRDELLLIRLCTRREASLRTWRGNAAAPLSDEQELIPTGLRRPAPESPITFHLSPFTRSTR
jgi:hypothetical protein